MAYADVSDGESDWEGKWEGGGVEEGEVGGVELKWRWSEVWNEAL